MKNKSLLISGNLELYVLKDLPPNIIQEIGAKVSQDIELQKEIIEIEKALKTYAFKHEMNIPEITKSLLITMINYAERIKNGEKPTTAPALSHNSKVIDFKPWLDRKELQEPNEYDSMFGHIISVSDKRKTLVVWLKNGAPSEIHTTEIEKFLILEGSCTITIANETHLLEAGSFIEIPLFISHHVIVTSKQRCKIILERSAA